jgi:hypothetical protein
MTAEALDLIADYLTDGFIDARDAYVAVMGVTR